MLSAWYELLIRLNEKVMGEFSMKTVASKDMQFVSILQNKL